MKLYGIEAGWSERIRTIYLSRKSSDLKWLYQTPSDGWIPYHEARGLPPTLIYICDDFWNSLGLPWPEHRYEIFEIDIQFDVRLT